MVQEGGGEKGEKNWDNCNSIVNKIYFKKEQAFANGNLARNTVHSAEGRRENLQDK